jgi:hypothetical protein
MMAEKIQWDYLLHVCTYAHDAMLMGVGDAHSWDEEVISEQGPSSPGCKVSEQRTFFWLLGGLLKCLLSLFQGWICVLQSEVSTFWGLGQSTTLLVFCDDLIH